MAASMNCWVAVIFIPILCFISKEIEGLCGDCNLENLIVGTAATGELVKNKPEWEVTVTNDCPCALYDIYVECKGFQSLERVPVTMFVPFGDNCLVYGGRRIEAGASISFRYAWDSPFSLPPVRAQVEC